MKTTNRLPRLLLALAAMAAAIGALTVQAQSTKAESTPAENKAADPSGTWVWGVPARTGGPDRTNTLTLKLDGEKLTGKLATPGRDGQLRESAVDDGKLSGSDISFSITREFNGNSFTMKYSGKVEADSINGKVEFERNGETQSRDWHASRLASKPESPKPGSADKAEQK
jgi:hypothetical protein